jgi:signal peptidase I
VGLFTLTTAACGRAHVNGQAMSPTIKDGETVVVTTTIEPLVRGDIVAFKYPLDESKQFVKRIVGLPGEQLEILDDGTVVVNGRGLDETYVLAENRSSASLPARQIPNGNYFMMGDNRRNSSDSRHWGTVKRELIVSKVVGR